MLYESPKNKKYILIGTAGVFLAVLVIVAIPSLYKNKTTQTPTANLPAVTKQQKIQKDMHEAAKKLQDQPLSEQQTKDDTKSASEKLQKLPKPSPEDMQKVSKELN